MMKKLNIWRNQFSSHLKNLVYLFTNKCHQLFKSFTSGIEGPGWWENQNMDFKIISLPTYCDSFWILKNKTKQTRKPNKPLLGYLALKSMFQHQWTQPSSPSPRVLPTGVCDGSRDSRTLGLGRSLMRSSCGARAVTLRPSEEALWPTPASGLLHLQLVTSTCCFKLQPDRLKQIMYNLFKLISSSLFPKEPQKS